MKATNEDCCRRAGTRSEASARRRRDTHALRQEGKTQTQIAAALGVSQKCVSQYLAGPVELVRQQKEPQPRRIGPETRERIERAQRLKEAGLPQHEIARQMGVTEACVSMWLKLGQEGTPASDAPPRPKGRTVAYHYRSLLSPEQRAELAALTWAEPRAAWTARRVVVIALERYGVRCSERSARRMLRQWFAARQEQDQ